MDNATLMKTTAEMAAAYFSKNEVAPADVPGVIKMIADSLRPAPVQVNQEPAVPVARSVTTEYLICLEDGMRLKSLKRYLRRQFGLSPDEYRAKWGLPADYPMVAPEYSVRRSELAKQMGLGRKTSVQAPVEAEVSVLAVEDTIVDQDGENLLICLEDGKVVRDLGRHLRRNYQISAADYRTKYDLPAEYPMTAQGIENFLKA